MSRISKSIKNAKVNFFFQILAIFVGFFSRKIFLDYLGADFVGLTSLLVNILGFLNLAELGISTAVGYNLYKPIYDNDQVEINNLIQFFGHVYKRIGLTVLGLGIIVSLFLPLFFPDTPFSFVIIYFAFFTFLTSSLLGYFTNYHQTLLQSDQKDYIIQQYYQSVGVLKSILQIVLIFFYQNYYLWIFIELLFAIILAIILRKQIRKVYPWLQINLDNSKSDIIKKYPNIIKLIKQAFVHKFSFFILMGTDQILIYMFVNLKSVAFFGNYQLLFGHLKVLTNKIFEGTQASIGNLISEGDPINIKKVFWEIMAIRHFFGGFLFLSLYYLTEDFIVLWLGEEYILSSSVLILMLGNIYISQIRSPVDNFIHGYGDYSDTWAPITETALNLLISVIFGSYYGITGIMLGTFISTFLIVVLWKPYFLYKKGFKVIVWEYWKGFFKLFLSFVLSMLLINFVIQNFINNEIANFIDWVIYSIQIVAIIIITYVSILYLFNNSFRDFTVRIKHLVLNKINNGGKN